MEVDAVSREVERELRKSVWRDEGTAVGRQFFRLHQRQVIVRLRVDPGEAYIAPTENVFHDGSTEGFFRPSHFLYYRGHFKAK